MTTRDLTEAEFSTTIEGNDIVLVDFWAAWCGPCRSFAPVFAAASEKHPEIVFAKVDTEAEQRLAAAAQVTSIPTLMAFREGVLVFSQPGALPAAALEEVIGTVNDLDMSDIHQQVNAQRALLDQPREATLEEFITAHDAGSTVIDVREPMEYRAGHVPGAIMLPLGQLPDKLDKVRDKGPVYVICASGNRSLQATDFLRTQGVEAYSVAGGTDMWAADGREVITGPYAAAQG